MLTQADLTQADWGRIRPGLRVSLRTASRNMNRPIRELATRGLLPFVGWIQPNRLDAHVFIKHADGQRYWLLEEDIPTGWTARHWVDFVVKVVKSPHVLQAGTFHEWIREGAGIPRIPFRGVRIRTPAELHSVALRAPEETITPLLPGQPPVVCPGIGEPVHPGQPVHPGHPPGFPGAGIGVPPHDFLDPIHQEPVRQPVLAQIPQEWLIGGAIVVALGAAAFFLRRPLSSPVVEREYRPRTTTRRKRTKRTKRS